MNILFLTYEVVDAGGNFVRCFSLAKTLSELGHTVTILASNKRIACVPRTTVRNGVRIVEIPCILPWRIRHDGMSPFQMLGRMVYIWNSKPDIIHGFGHRPSVSLPAFFCGRILHIPVFADWSDLWGREGMGAYFRGFRRRWTTFFDHMLEIAWYGSVQRVTAISRDLKQRAKKIRTDPNSIYLLPVGSDINGIVPLSKQAMRKKYNLPLYAPIVVYVGNTPYDLPLLGDTLQELVYRKPNILLLYIGKQHSSFQRNIQVLGLDKNIKFFGFIQHDMLGEYLACGDVLFLPYSNTGVNRGRFPNKIGDYMAAGRPIVANPTGDMRMVFRYKKIGVLVPANAKHCARAILSLLKNKKKCVQYGHHARTLAEERYAWKHLAKHLEQQYLRVR